MEPYISISSVEVARMIRKELKESFRDIKFSVRSDHNAVNVKWTDGPTTDVVNAITSKFEAGSFDGMTDSYNYRDTYLNGQQVHFSTQYIFVTRSFSPEWEAATAAEYERLYGKKADERNVNDMYTMRQIRENLGVVGK